MSSVDDSDVVAIAIANIHRIFNQTHFGCIDNKWMNEVEKNICECYLKQVNRKGGTNDPVQLLYLILLLLYINFHLLLYLILNKSLWELKSDEVQSKCLS